MCWVVLGCVGVCVWGGVLRCVRGVCCCDMVC